MTPTTGARSEPKGTSLSPQLKTLLREGYSLFEKHQDDDARERLERALVQAREENNSWGEGEAHRILGLILIHAARYLNAEAELGQALSLFESSDAHDRVALVHGQLGVLAGLMGNRPEAARLFRLELSEYEALADLQGQAMTLQSLGMTEGIPKDERAEYLQRGLNLARRLGNRRLEGSFLHNWGDGLYTQGDFAGALEKLQEAAACFQDAHDQGGLAHVLTSLGRLHRAHGSYEEAIRNYEHALAIQKEIGDNLGVIQSLNAEAISYDFLGKERESLECYERALSLARETGSPRAIGFMTGNLGGFYVNHGQYDRAIKLLSESLRLDPSSEYVGNRYGQLSEAYRGAGQYELALESADKGVDLTRAKGSPEYLGVFLRDRALAHEKLKQFPDALSDIEEAIRELEQLRAHLVPADYMKRGFSDQNQNLFADAIRMREVQGQDREAMVTAEESRARAFADLLAARGIQTASAKASESRALAKPESGKRESNGQEVAQDSVSTGLLTRGGEARRPSPLSKEMGTLADLASPASSSPPSLEQMVAIAKRLDSTILSYWVSPEETRIWVLKPDGSVRAKRTGITEVRLSRLVKATWQLESEPPMENAKEPEGANGSPPKPQEKRPGAMRLRGGGELLLSDSSKQAWRELYKLLIQPVRDALPARGSRLTIVPHGPLFLLSFAALLDERGHYLVEDYALNYTPSLGVLQFTGKRKEQISARAPGYLLVADPQLSAKLQKDTALPPLPGARLEAQTVKRLLPAAETSTLVAGEATKEAVREQVRGKSVLHFATHAIVRDDQPFESFLALGGNSSGSDDGRLTVQEIYGLDLQADLVVLSACRTALGKASGDGMVGMTRAFFYAGASSVMATLWDVADEPTNLLISDFYSSLRKGKDKSRALQAAQLHLLRGLRAGRVKVKTPAGVLTLAEHPVFWAGFVLQGEP